MGGEVSGKLEKQTQGKLLYWGSVVCSVVCGILFE